jgi:hypothetical protein
MLLHCPEEGFSEVGDHKEEGQGSKFFQGHSAFIEDSSPRSSRVAHLWMCLLCPSAGKVDGIHELRGGQEHEPSGEGTP